MSLWKIAWRSIQQRAVASALTSFSMALGVALVVTVLVFFGVLYQSLHRGAEGYDLIVGPRGGTEQLVLNTVFYIGDPVGKLPYQFYKDLEEGRINKNVEAVIPVCMGHIYQGFRVIGTTPEIFDRLTYFGGQSYQFADGENFRAEDPFAAVAGAVAAKESGLRPGAKFKATHGTGQSAARQHEEEFTVTGVLKPTGTPVDRAIFVNMEGFYLIHAKKDQSSEGTEADGTKAAEHTSVPPAQQNSNSHNDDRLQQIAAISATTRAKSEAGSGGKADGDLPQAHSSHSAESHSDACDNHDCQHHDHHDHREVSALLVVVPERPPGLVEKVAFELNNGTFDGVQVQAVVPGRVVASLFERFVGKLEAVLLVMAVLIVVVAGVGIMVSIYNSMSERRREIAIMRALGANRVTVMLVVLLESILLALGGGALGMLLGHGLVTALAPWIAQWTGIAVGLFQFRLVELLLIPGLIALASAVGYLPAVIAYRTDVAEALTANP